MTMIDYLVEIRSRLIKSLLLIGGLFLLFFIYSKPLFTLIAEPLTSILPQGSHLIATKITSPLVTPLQLSVNLALLLGMPFVLYQLWNFLAPALYHKERRLMIALMLSSTCLFFAGIIFCYFILLPLLFNLFNNALPQSILLMPDISYYLDFITRLCLIFGLCFQLPLVNILLVRLDIVSITQLKQFRPYAIVGSFTLGMLLTPPDVISQLFLAIPLTLLYETGILLAQRNKQSIIGTPTHLS